MGKWPCIINIETCKRGFFSENRGALMKKKNEHIKHLRVYVKKENPERKGLIGHLRFWKPKYIEMFSFEKSRTRV